MPVNSVGTLYNDGRELALLNHLSSLPSSQKSDPPSVLAAIDDYSAATSDKFLMNIGPNKGKILRQVVADVKPKVMVELGGYVGYSAINLAGEMVRQNEGSKEGLRYFSLEISPDFANIARQTIALAGLEEVVTIIVGHSYEGLRRLKEEQGVDQIDILLIDHYFPAYKTDLQRAESLGLVRPGTTLVADNVIIPGVPEYVSYVRGETQDGRYKYESRMEKASVMKAGEELHDGMEISKCVEEPIM